MMLVTTVAVVLFLIFVNAFYVAAEFSAVATRRSRLRQLADDGSLLAARLLPVVEDPVRLDRYVAACQIGITLSSLVLGAYGQATLAEWLAPRLQVARDLEAIAAQSLAATTVLIGLTVVQVLLGELVPKAVALQHPTRTALATVLPMRWSLAVLAWFIAVLNGSGAFILKLFGSGVARHRHIHSPEELELLIAESRAGGLLHADEYRRLYRALRFGTRTVRRLMVPRPKVAALEVETPLDEAVRIVAESPHTRLPLYRESIDNVVALLHTRDLAVHYVKHGTTGSLADLAQPVLAVYQTVTADRLLNLFQQRRSHLAIVIDEFGAVSGLITLTDLLEELLGEIADERKELEPVAERLSDGRIRLPGALPLDEVELWTGVPWRGEAETVGGHVSEVLGHLPAAGERLMINGVDVEVEALTARAVSSVLASGPSSGARGSG